MSPIRKAYPSDVSDDEWALVVPYLTLVRKDILDSRTLRATPESGERAGYDGTKRKQGSTLHMAVDTFGHLLALHVRRPMPTTVPRSDG